MEKFPTPKQPTNPERHLEHISSLEEVRNVLEKLLAGKEYEEILREEDEDGLYKWEVKIITPEGITEYAFKREGSYDKNNARRVDVIHETFYDKDGTPTGGGSVAKYIDGEWKLTP